jgi:hypothetical protein
MILPRFALHLTTTMLQMSKEPHDMAIDALTTTISWSHEHQEIPLWIRDGVVDSLSDVLMFGDLMGHNLLKLYIYIAHLLM